jgi:CHASE2 domain-containing sensor protein
VVQHALAEAPGDRPGSAGEIAQAVTRAAARAARMRWRRREVPKRVAAAGALAVGLTMLQPALEPLDLVRRLEGLSFDARVRWSSPRPADPRLLLVSIDDRSLLADQTPLPNRADEVGTRLASLAAAGADVVGVDLLLPAHWAQSRPFADLILGHAPRLALAVAQQGDERLGPEAITGLIAGALGTDRARDLFAAVNVEPDPDGVVRTARAFYDTANGAPLPTMAARLAGWPRRVDLADRPAAFPVDYRIAGRSIERIGWSDLDAVLRRTPSRFAGRLVLVGAEFAGAGDRHLAPRPGAPAADITGFEQQALIAATLLAPDRLATPAGWRRAGAMALLAVLAAMATLAALLRAGSLRLLTVALGLPAAWALLAAGAFGAGVVLPVAAPCAQLLAALALGIAWAHRWAVRPPSA